MLNLDLSLYLEFEVLSVFYGEEKRRKEKREEKKKEEKSCDYIYIIDSMEANEERIVLICGGAKINNSNLFEFTRCSG